MVARTLTRSLFRFHPSRYHLPRQGQTAMKKQGAQVKDLSFWKATNWRPVSDGIVELFAVESCRECEAPCSFIRCVTFATTADLAANYIYRAERPQEGHRTDDKSGPLCHKCYLDWLNPRGGL